MTQREISDKILSDEAKQNRRFQNESLKLYGKNAVKYWRTYYIALYILILLYAVLSLKRNGCSYGN